LPRGSDPPPAPLSLDEAAARWREDAGALAALRRILREADDRAEQAGLPCRACGACCHFEEFGHRLYVTAGELAVLAAQPAPQPGRAGRCPYQLDSRCQARDRRPLGCRVFFCDADRPDATRRLYERLHRRIRSLHERRRLPYAYVELTAGLAEVLQRTARPPATPQPRP
jgi:Fe-S-cluster containining protein